jgi:hypothetical protein
MQTEIAPKCAVTTGLLIALHHTAHGTDDVVDRVIEMDDHPWVSIPDDLSKEEHESMRKRCRHFLGDRIRSILKKFIGPHAKDRSKLTKAGCDRADISRCLNCLLRDKYVSMPQKRFVSQKRSTSQTVSVGVSAPVQMIGDVVGTQNFGDRIRPTDNEE